MGIRDSPSTTREENFGDEQRLRPGDLITTAVVEGRKVAVDVGVTSQAKRTQRDPVEDYAHLKLRKYRRIIDSELTPEGIAFRAAVWSQEGRPGKDAVAVIEGLCHQSDKYIPHSRKTEVRERLQHEITDQLQIRIVKMIRACIP